MYRIIGKDGQQYGPVTAEQLRGWIAENRANAQTLVQTDGSQEWKPLGSLPEFAADLKPPPMSAMPPPTITAATLRIQPAGVEQDPGRHCAGFCSARSAFTNSSSAIPAPG